MCGRFDQRFGPEALSAAVAALGGQPADVEAGLLARTRRHVVPGASVLVLRSGEPTAFTWLTFGVRTGQGALVINARRETLSQRPLFRRAREHGRVAVPIRGFYEFSGARGAKVPFYYHWGGALRWLGGLAVGTGLVVITEPARPPVVAVHPRAPVVLAHQGCAAWLARGELVVDASDPQAVELDHAFSVPDERRDPLTRGEGVASRGETGRADLIRGHAGVAHREGTSEVIKSDLTLL